MNSEQLKHILEENMSGVQADRFQYQSILLQISKDHKNKSFCIQRGTFCLHKGVLVTILVMLLMSATAFAVSVFPNVYQWLVQRTDAVRLNNLNIDSTNTESFQMGTIEVTILEAVSDGNSFLCNLRFNSVEELLIPYGGFRSELVEKDMDNPEGLPVAYISVHTRCGDYDNEIYTAEYDDQGVLYIMCEGIGNVESESELLVAISIERSGESTQKKVAVPIQQLSTLQELCLITPLRLGDTGYVIDRLSLLKTELRTYVDWNVSVDHPPLTYAIKCPFVVLIDSQGNVVHHYWAYQNEAPYDLTIQLWSDDRDELLYTKTLSIKDFEEVTP